MASRAEAVEAVARHLGTPGTPKRIFADAGDGRWLVLGAPNLAVDKDGKVKTTSEVFTTKEIARLWQVFHR